MNSTRHTLIQKIKDQSDEQAWKTFTQAYEGYIEAVLRKVGIPTADTIDLRQDIILKLWKQLPDFDFEAKRGKFRTWLYRMIRNTAYTHLASRNQEKKRVEKYFQEKPEGRTAFDKLLREQWKSHLCQKALNNIKNNFSAQSVEIFEKSLKGQAVEDIAQHYNLKENTIYRIKNRVKERLIVEVQRLRDELE